MFSIIYTYHIFICLGMETASNLHKQIERWSLISLQLLSATPAVRHFAPSICSQSWHISMSFSNRIHGELLFLFAPAKEHQCHISKT